MMDVAIIDLNIRTLHAPGAVHGYARCGQQMGDPWMAGPVERVAEHAARLCGRCFPEWGDARTIT
jgi:hypothetical protein